MPQLGRGQPKRAFITRAAVGITPPAGPEHVGNGAVAATATAVNKKVAVQGGTCDLAAAAVATGRKVAVHVSNGASAATTQATEKKVAVQGGNSAVAPAGIAAQGVLVVGEPTQPIIIGAANQTALYLATLGQGRPKRAFITRAALAVEAPAGTPAQGLAAAALDATAVNRKVAIQTGTCALAAGSTASSAATVTAAVPKPLVSKTAAEVAARRYGIPSVAFIDFGPPLVQATEAQVGTGTVATTTSATEKKVAAQVGAGTQAATSTAVEKKVAVQRGTCAAAITSTRASVTTRPAAGTTPTAATTQATEKKVAAQRGTCATGPAGTSTAKKITTQRGTTTAAFATTRSGVITRAQSGRCAFGPTGTTTHRKVGTQTGTTPLAATTTGKPGHISQQTARTCTAPLGIVQQTKRASTRGLTTAAFAQGSVLVEPPRIVKPRLHLQPNPATMGMQPNLATLNMEG